MTEEEKGIIMNIMPKDAADDICGAIEHLIERDLSSSERRDMSTKAKFWFLMGAQKQNLIIENKFNKMLLPRHKPEILCSDETAKELKLWEGGKWTRQA